MIVVDSMWVEFRVDGSASLRLRSFGTNLPKEGGYTLTSNSVDLKVPNQFQYTHRFLATWNATSGVLSGTFQELTWPNPKTGMTKASGSFNLSRY